jgi:hypothetical protein
MNHGSKSFALILLRLTWFSSDYHQWFSWIRRAPIRLVNHHLVDSQLIWYLTQINILDTDPLSHQLNPFNFNRIIPWVQFCIHNTTSSSLLTLLWKGGVFTHSLSHKSLRYFTTDFLRRNEGYVLNSKELYRISANVYHITASHR